MLERARVRRIAIVAGAVALVASLFGLRAALATDPLERLAPGVEGRTGTWWFPRGGPYKLGFEAPGPAELIVDGERVLLGRGPACVRFLQPPRPCVEPKWQIFSPGPHAVTFRGPPGSRLLWSPVGRRGQPEYVPESSLSPEPPERARFGAGVGARRRDGAIALGIVIVVVAAAWSLARPRLCRRTAAIGGAIFVAALAVRWWGLGAAGQTWDEDEYWTAGRNYLVNLLALDFRPTSWEWNFQHPPMTKYLAGLGALWQDGFGAARAVFAILGAGTCALAFLIGRRLFGERAGVLAGVASALTPHLVAHSKVIGHEAPSVFFWALAIWLALRAQGFGAPEGAGSAADAEAAFPRRLAWVGVAMGLAVATRFTNLLLLPVVGVTLLAAAPRGRFVRTLVLGPLLTIPACAVTFFALWPRMWSDPIGRLDAAWNVLKHPHGAEPYLGALVIKPPWHYFPMYVIATTPLVLLAAALLLGAWRGATRRERGWLIALAWLLAPFGVAWSPVRQDGLRYVLPALVPLALAAGAGLDRLAAALRHPRAGQALVGALALYLAVACARIHPYYLDYYAEHVGGPGKVARRGWFEIGWWGEGIAEAIAVVNARAAPNASVCRLVVPDHTTWFREDLWRRMTKIPSQAEWIVVNGPGIRRGDGRDPRVPADAVLEHVVEAQGAPLVHVYRRPVPGAGGR